MHLGFGAAGAPTSIYQPSASTPDATNTSTNMDQRRFGFHGRPGRHGRNGDCLGPVYHSRLVYRSLTISNAPISTARGNLHRKNTRAVCYQKHQSFRRPQPTGIHWRPNIMRSYHQRNPRHSIVKRPERKHSVLRERPEFRRRLSRPFGR